MLSLQQTDRRRQWKAIEARLRRLRDEYLSAGLPQAAESVEPLIRVACDWIQIYNDVTGPIESPITAPTFQSAQGRHRRPPI